MLEEGADKWWRTIRHRDGKAVSTISWDKLKQHFYDHYPSIYLWKRQIMELLDLEQGILSVAECIERFVDLGQ